MTKVTIYHSPKCMKSREALTLLKEHDIEPMIIEYLKTPPTAEELKQILKLLQIKPHDLIRKKEATYKEKVRSPEKMTDDQWIQLMVKYPVLIERPIVIAGNKARIGRPPEKILEIL